MVRSNEARGNARARVPEGDRATRCLPRCCCCRESFARYPTRSLYTAFRTLSERTARRLPSHTRTQTRANEQTQQTVSSTDSACLSNLYHSLYNFQKLCLSINRERTAFSADLFFSFLSSLSLAFWPLSRTSISFLLINTKIHLSQTVSPVLLYLCNSHVYICIHISGKNIRIDKKSSDKMAGRKILQHEVKIGRDSLITKSCLNKQLKF